MSRTAVWFFVVSGMAIYRAMSNTATPVEEHIAGAYFSAFALGLHWFLERARP